MTWTPNLSATLHRLSDAESSEEIGSGPLFKMVRIALSDPDDEVWRYSIKAGGDTIAGRQIAVVSGMLGNADTA
jgi:hypothetical protein